jgi:protein-tyrosine phosphatase
VEAASAYGIRTVLDLRSEPECAADMPAHPDFVHKRLSLFDHFDGDATYRDELLARMASREAAEKHRTLYREALELDAARFVEAVGVLAQAEDGVLFHCVGGKDRTGLLAALVLRLVGVPIEEVEADYVHSETRLRLRDGTPPHRVSAPHGVVDDLLVELEARHGTVAAYLVSAGTPPEDLERIRCKLG